MKTLLALLLLIPSLSLGNMISLNQYLNQNPDIKENEIFYISTRCSAIYLLGVQLSKNQPEISKRLQESYESSISIAALARSGIHPNDSDSSHLSNILETMDLILDRYVELSNENYISTGSYYNELMWDDMEVCKVMLESS